MSTRVRPPYLGSHPSVLAVHPRRENLHLSISNTIVSPVCTATSIPLPHPLTLPPRPPTFIHLLSLSSSTPMDRRRRRPIPRPLRRPLHLLRRYLHPIDYQYLLISLTLLLLFTLLIVSLTSASDKIPLSYPPFFPYHHPANPPHSTSRSHAAKGSIAQLDQTLSAVTAHSPHHKLVIVIAVNYAFRKLALNFVCNLKRLRLFNYLILAMDHAVYQYLAARAANVFFYDPSFFSSSDATNNTITRRRLLQHDHIPSNNHLQVHPDNFGTPAFLETSRRKSILVLKVLRLGYAVLFSDVDVVWVRNPLPPILQHNRYHFVLQSDRAHLDSDTALNYNLNSGFYLVRSSQPAITAMQAIVKYAQALRRSEQKAFNYVLCGAFKDHHAGPGIRIGAEQCNYRKVGATAKLLPLDMFPNGSDDSLWQNRSDPFQRTFPRVVAVHANYVEGCARKVQRIKLIGFWFHSDEASSVDECLPLTEP